MSVKRGLGGLTKLTDVIEKSALGFMTYMVFFLQESDRCIERHCEMSQCSSGTEPLVLLQVLILQHWHQHWGAN